MAKQNRIINCTPSGHGHYKVTISRYNKTHTAIIDDMQLVDDFKDGIVRAANDLYDTVIRKCNIGKYAY